MANRGPQVILLKGPKASHSVSVSSSDSTKPQRSQGIDAFSQLPIKRGVVKILAMRIALLQGGVRSHTRDPYTSTEGTTTMRMLMRKLVAHVVAPMALALGIFLIGAPSASADGADVYGVGGGSINFPDGDKAMKFAFSAHSGPNGDFGSFRFTIEPPLRPVDVHVDVDCVNVSPNGGGAGGWIGGKVKEVTPFPNAYGIRPGDEMLFGINDFGEPPDTPADELLASTRAAPQMCRSMRPGRLTPISQGNITIKLVK